MSRSGEEIKRSDPAVTPALLFKEGAVAGEGRGIARNIDDTLRRCLTKRADKLGRQSLAGRVDHNYVGSADEGGRVFGGVAGDEFGALDAVVTCVEFGILDRFGDYLNSAQDGFGVVLTIESPIVPAPQ